MGMKRPSPSQASLQCSTRDVVFGYEDKQQSRNPVTVEIVGASPIVVAIFSFMDM